MSRKYPKPIPHFRPVSQNAYDTFVRRIYAVVPMDHRCGAMIEALDKYLAGDRETYAAHLDEHTAMAFEMLRFEIDKAIERSARARRPRRRKDVAEAVTVISQVVETKSEPDVKPDVKPEVKTVAEPISEHLVTALNQPRMIECVVAAGLLPTPDHAAPVGLRAEFLAAQLPDDSRRPRLPRRLRRAVDRVLHNKHRLRPCNVSV